MWPNTNTNICYSNIIRIFNYSLTSVFKKSSFLLLGGGIDLLLLRPFLPSPHLFLPPRPQTRPIFSCVLPLSACSGRQCCRPCTVRPSCRSCTFPHSYSFRNKNSREEIWAKLRPQPFLTNWWLSPYGLFQLWRMSWPNSRTLSHS